VNHLSYYSPSKLFLATAALSLIVTMINTSSSEH
jgi:hypothetical protein